MDDSGILIAICALVGLWRGRVVAVRPFDADPLPRVAGAIAAALVAARGIGLADNARDFAWHGLGPLGAFVLASAASWALCRALGALTE